MRKCRMCANVVIGRSDKQFCSVACKSMYHHKLSKATHQQTLKIDAILHRNHSILLEVMGKNTTQTRTTMEALALKKFNFNYVTKYTINKQGKTYNHVYNFAWMSFSDDGVLIIRKS